MKLGKKVFVALAAIAWADGEVVEAEAQALIHAAKAWGIHGAELAEVEEATRRRMALESVSALGLVGDERLLVYSIAVWLTQIDGVVVPTERETLERLGAHLGMSAEERQFAATEHMFSATILAGVTGRHDVLALARQMMAQAATGLDETTPQL